MDKAEEAEKERSFDDLSEKAMNGNTEAMITLLKKSGRGYEMNDNELEGFLGSR